MIIKARLILLFTYMASNLCLAQKPVITIKMDSKVRNSDSIHFCIMLKSSKAFWVPAYPVATPIKEDFTFILPVIEYYSNGQYITSEYRGFADYPIVVREPSLVKKYEFEFCDKLPTGYNFTRGKYRVGFIVNYRPKKKRITPIQTNFTYIEVY